MKKFTIALGLMLSALALTNCTTNEGEVVTPDVKGGAFEIYAAPATRTAATGTATAWVAGDEINLFHAEAGTQDYIHDVVVVSSSESTGFSIAAEDVAAGRFTGTLASALTADAYDWYAFYPYSSYIETPANTDAGYTTVGKATQTQVGNDNQDHIDGTDVPLYGQAKNVAKGSAPTINMKHVTTLMKINVTNSSEAAITIEKIELTCTQNITGSYFVNFAGDELTFNSKYPTKTATLNVTNGTPIAVGASASFYVAVKPFTAAAGNTLTIKITPTEGAAFSKTATLTAGQEFASGVINKLNIAYAPPVFVPAPYVLASSIAVGDEILITSGKTDGSIKVMGALSDNGEYCTQVNGTITDGVLTSTNDMTVLTVGAGTTTPTSFTLYNEAQGYLYSTLNGKNYLKVQDNVTESAEWAISFDANSVATIKAGTGTTTTDYRNWIRWNESSTRFSCYSSGQKDVYIFKKSTATVINATDKTIAYAAATGVEVPFTVVNKSGAVTATEKTDGFNMIDNLAVDEENNKITFDVTVNDGEGSRTAIITISNNGVNKDITITQAAAPTKLVLQGLTCSTSNETSLVFTWTANTDAEGYQVSTDGGTTYGETQTAATYTWTGLTASTQYTLYVKAIGDNVEYLDSDPVSEKGTTASEGSVITYTLVDKIANLTAGIYYLAGYKNVTDTYYLWCGTVSDTSANSGTVPTTSNSDCVTVVSTYASNTKVLTVGSNAVEMTLVATGTTNVYNIKYGDKYLAVSSTKNRRLYLSDTAVAWTFSNNTKGGMTGTTTDNNKTVYLYTNSTGTSAIRSYITTQSDAYGVYFFKKN